MGGEITAGLLTDGVTSLDPHRVGISHQIKIMQNIFSGLVRMNQNAEIVGDLASDWSLPDSTTYVFDIVDDATFQNGDPCDAEAIKWSLERLMAFEQSQHAGKVSGVSGIEVSGNELTINLNEPETAFISYLTTGPGRAGAIVHPSAEENRDEYNRMPIGSGPFRITGRSSGESITLQRFKNYWKNDEEGNQLPYLDQVNIRLIPEPSTMWTAVSSGDIDIASRITGQFGRQARNVDSLAVESKSTGQWTMLRMMTKNPADNPEYAQAATRGTLNPVPDLGDDIPTADARVRRAVSKALDREALSQKGFFDFAITAHQLYNPVTFMYEENPDRGQFYAPEEAKQLLDEAGYTGDPRFKAEMVTSPTYERVATAIKSQLSEVGIAVTINILQPSIYYSSDGVRGFNTLFGIGTGASDIDPWMSHWRQLGYSNEVSGKGDETFGSEKYNLWHDEKFDDLIIEDSQTPDQERRKELLSQAMDIFVEQSPWAMAVFSAPPVVRNKNLNNVGTQVGLMSFARASVS
jgi:peptide/nickel transport system substrate-binding protein